MPTFPHSPQSAVRRVTATRVVPLSLILALLVPGLEILERLTIPLMGVALGALAYYGVGFVLAVQDLNPLCPKWLLKGFCLFAFYFFGLGGAIGALSTLVFMVVPEWFSVTPDAMPRQLAGGLAAVPIMFGAAAGAHRAYAESSSAV